jgi:putative transposase
VIQHAVWLYFRFSFSMHDVDEMLAHRGVDVSYETVRAWTVKFGPKIAANLRRRKLPPSPRWHLDEMVSTIAGEHVWIWRAVGDEGGVMDMIVQKRRDALAAVRFLRRLLKNQHVEPEVIVTDGLRPSRVALDRLGLADRHRPGRLRENNRAENSHLSIRRRERKM